MADDKRIDEIAIKRVDIAIQRERRGGCPSQRWTCTAPRLALFVAMDVRPPHHFGGSISTAFSQLIGRSERVPRMRRRAHVMVRDCRCELQKFPPPPGGQGKAALRPRGGFRRLRALKSTRTKMSFAVTDGPLTRRKRDTWPLVPTSWQRSHRLARDVAGLLRWRHDRRGGWSRPARGASTRAG